MDYRGGGGGGGMLPPSQIIGGGGCPPSLPTPMTWLLGSLLVMFVCFSILVVCFDTPGISRCRSTLVLLSPSPPTVEFQWLEHFWDPGNMFETGVVRANEC